MRESSGLLDWFVVDHPYATFGALLALVVLQAVFLVLVLRRKRPNVVGNVVGCGFAMDENRTRELEAGRRTKKIETDLWTKGFEVNTRTRELETGTRTREFEVSARTKEFETGARIDKDERAAMLATLAELRRAVEEARVAEKAKDSFLANISHEIRTPLNAVIGFAELLRDPGIDPATRNEYLSGISEAGNALMALVNDVLDISKLSAGKMLFTLEETSLPELVSSVEKVFRLKCRTKNIAFVENVPDDFPLVWIDRLRMRQILFNIIGNVVKFTESGSIVVSARLEKKTGETGDVVLCVTDTGPGIAEDEIRNICDPFIQSYTIRGTQKANSGTGLGLAICKKMLAGMNGGLTIESTVGKGSTFEVDLYRVRFREERPSVKQACEVRLDHAAAPGISVLLVDDVAMNLTVLKMMLKRDGVVVETARSGEEALEILENRVFDVVLTDLWMPGLDGMELARLVRRDPRHAKTRIAVVTADTFGGDRFDFSVFDGVLTKPVIPDELRRFLNAISRR